VNKYLKIALIATLAIIGIFFIYRILFIRTVSYNVGGITIPARYNALTGKAVPIANYKGKAINKTVTDRNSDKIGLDSEDVTAAQFRWALFEEWANSRPQYKGWESDPELFKKANEDFKNSVQANVKVIK
jgi:hypothetical protein